MDFVMNQIRPACTQSDENIARMDRIVQFLGHVVKIPDQTCLATGPADLSDKLL
jgi:hypothetical protein